MQPSEAAYNHHHTYNRRHIGYSRLHQIVCALLLSAYRLSQQLRQYPTCSVPQSFPMDAVNGITPRISPCIMSAPTQHHHHIWRPRKRQPTQGILRSGVTADHPGRLRRCGIGVFTDRTVNRSSLSRCCHTTRLGSMICQQLQWSRTSGKRLFCPSA